ncbi:Histidine phosphatase superfamily, clade-1 [Sesbania bispinosa]|nr:Histidine phosphatase superfamily, clade-1 [Sesbania bispinosa]
MAAEAYHQAIGTLQSHSYLNNCNNHRKLRNNLVRLVINDFVSSNGLSRRGSSHCVQRNCSVIRCSSSQISVVDPVSSPSISNTGDTYKKSNEAALILIRHDEAIEAGKRISSIPVDVIFTSALIRAQMTAMLAMTQHRRRKVPVILHNESEQARTWSQIFSEDTKKQSIPVIASWQLNERMYGELQGLNKQETADRYGKEQVHEWRRSYDIPPPNGESLEMCAERAIEPQLLSGKNVMIAAHGNSLRSIIMYLDKLTSQEVISLELSTGIPMLYIFKEGRFIRRGSPLGPSEAGVYCFYQGRNWMRCSNNTLYRKYIHR